MYSCVTVAFLTPFCALKPEDGIDVQETNPLPEMYVPQMGDEVVYILQGHEKYLQTLNQVSSWGWL